MEGIWIDMEIIEIVIEYWCRRKVIVQIRNNQAFTTTRLANVELYAIDPLSLCR